MSHCHTLIETLRRRGYRITPQREMIVEAVCHSGRHLTAEEVFETVRLRTRAINIATVYRTLDLLTEEGFASRADLGEGRVVYATAEHGPHIHLVCRQCGLVTDVDVAPFAPLIEHIEAEYGFAFRPQHLAVRGLCAGCQSGESSPEKSPREE
jgi:Fur family ferric uptake transcriptional regulator